MVLNDISIDNGKDGERMSKLLGGLASAILFVIVVSNVITLNQLFDVIGELFKFGFLLIKAMFDLIFGIFKALL
jgi:hypothetical protein